MRSEAEALRKVVDALTSTQVPYFVGGSFASSAWGEARATHDFDLVVLMSAQQIPGFIEALGDGFLVSESELLEAAESQDVYRMAQLLHYESVFKFDLFFVADTPYTQSAFEQAKLIEDSLGQIKVASPENTIVEKLRWFELGNRISDRQWNDILSVIESQRNNFDLEYLRKWAAHFDVSELLEEAFRQARD